MAERYKIVRYVFGCGRPNRTIRKGLTLEEAQAWCDDPETSSSTAKGAKAKRISRRLGREWFDGYEREG